MRPLLLLCLFALGLLAGEPTWDDVHREVQQQKPQSALALVQQLGERARAADDAPGLALAAACTARISATISEGGRAEGAIPLLTAELPRLPAAARPFAEMLLAQWYWSYFQQNRWRFHDRTTTDSSGDDFTTWDLRRLFAEIDRRFAAALAAPELKTTPVAAFALLMHDTPIDDARQPTLFDFIAHQALAFHQAGEQGLPLGEDVFELDAEGPVLGPVDAFQAWKAQSADADARLLSAVRLYQDLLAFHRADTDRTAFLDADLARLRFGRNQAVGVTAVARYRAALERFAETNAQHPAMAEALAALAEEFAQEDPPRAQALAERGRAAFPASLGGIRCANRIAALTASELSVRTDLLWNQPWPTLSVTHRNLASVSFRVIACDYERLITGKLGLLSQLARQHWIEERDRPKLLGLAATRTWTAALPATPDLRERTSELAVPTDLAPGVYLVIASGRPDFAAADNAVAVAFCQVSDVMLISRNGPGRMPDGQVTHAMDGLVVDAQSGEPVAGATVRCWNQRHDGRQPEVRLSGTVTTDADGRFTVPHSANGQQSLVSVRRGAVEVGPINGWQHRGGAGEESASEATLLFTDRAIYRPGQTIHVKGICHRIDQAQNAYRVLAGQRATVTLRDDNGRELARLERTANDFGSWGATFTAPAGALTGALHIQAEPGGGVAVRVEEYKRPRFQVQLDAPTAEAVLGQQVDLTGTATAYSGAAIGGASVRWRVERQPRFPGWCWWGWHLIDHQGTRQVAHGRAVTGDDGRFAISFPALDDATVPASTQATFSFRVIADITDATGETRSATRTVQAGHVGAVATITAAEWLTADAPTTLTLRTATLDDAPLARAGTLSVHALVQPAQPLRRNRNAQAYDWRWRQRVLAQGRPDPDPADPAQWANGAQVHTRAVTTDAQGAATATLPLPVGIYRAVFATTDAHGRAVRAEQILRVVDPAVATWPVREPDALLAQAWSVAPDGTFLALWGTGYERGRAYIEIEHRGRVLHAAWTPADRTQHAIRLPITAALRGGVTLRTTAVRDNRLSCRQHVIQVPWSDRELSLRWERQLSKLGPQQEETWTAVISGERAGAVAAEMVATLYDASLDQFAPLAWPTAFAGFRSEHAWRGITSNDDAIRLQPMVSWSGRGQAEPLVYRRLDPRLAPSGQHGRHWYARARRGEIRTEFAFAAAELSEDDAGSAVKWRSAEDKDPSGGEPPAEPPPADVAAVVPRRNLAETAFFLPHLASDPDGTVRIRFTTPESLTTWRFLGFAHDRDLRAGLLTGSAVTSKELMVEPNPPRFVREGDVIAFTAKVSNQSDAELRGRVRLAIADAATDAARDAAVGNTTPEQDFTVPARQSRTFAWTLRIPDGAGVLTYNVVGAAAKLQDGETGYLPVLSRRILVTESLPLPLRGAGAQRVAFDKLLQSAASPTLRHQGLTVQMVSRPAWYAVLALPHLMGRERESTTNVFERYYANSLARHLATSTPRIRAVFDAWRATPALDSPLRRNPELKQVLLEETPWLAEARDEDQRRRDVGLLFDANHMDEQLRHALHELARRQYGDGTWPWYTGGPGDPYITLAITTGFGRLQHLGVRDLDQECAQRAIASLDRWISEERRRIEPSDDNAPSATQALYLYGRSFFLASRPIPKEHRGAVDFFLDRAARLWTATGSRQTQAHLALALARFGKREPARAIVASLRERAVNDAELGLHWRDAEGGHWWHQEPIAAQALMIEAFDEVAGDRQAVDDAQVWLLKQKQVQGWRSTSATADAVYALLGRGGDLLSDGDLVAVDLGGVRIAPQGVEAGTGFYEHRFAAAEVRPELGAITLTKTDAGVAWGSVHWQYLEDVARITPHGATPLTLAKTLWRKETTPRGMRLVPVDGALAVGDELVCRIELRTDRDLEYVHLKDQRGAGTEPIDVLSGWRRLGALACYQSTRDTASHFSFAWLPRGTHVIEYSVRVQLRGTYQSGIASLQCHYAPEFGAHSGSVELRVE